MFKKVDLDGFPVLRIDEIPYIDSLVLIKAQAEVVIFQILVILSLS